MKDYPTPWQRKMMWAALTACFVVVLYAPRIVGNYVGLHPMTVIVSIFVLSLIIGGVIGPLLAVPLTATLKVLSGRYVWGRRWREQALPIERVLAAEEIEVPTHHQRSKQCA
jgi:predicted PurR-regulated permease PerM